MVDDEYFDRVKGKLHRKGWEIYYARFGDSQFASIDFAQGPVESLTVIAADSGITDGYNLLPKVDDPTDKGKVIEATRYYGSIGVYPPSIECKGERHKFQIIRFYPRHVLLLNAAKFSYSHDGFLQALDTLTPLVSAQ